MTTIAAVMVGAVLVALILVLFPHSPDTIPADVPAGCRLGLPAGVAGAARGDVGDARAGRWGTS